MRTLPLLLAAVAVLLAGCGSGDDEPSAAPTHHARSHHTRAPTTPSATPTTPSPTRRPTRTPEASETTPTGDPRWVFYTDDKRLWRSPWFAGEHPIMVPFGCTKAPYYDPDPTCPGGEGKHHGIDIAMPCGTPLRTGRAAEVLDNASLGSAYGVNPVFLRVGRYDVVIGHTTRVFVTPGETLAQGERFALAGDSGAPDGCHLHFEVRPAGAPYTDAIDPRPLLGLAVAAHP